MKPWVIFFVASLATLAGCLQIFVVRTPFNPAEHEYASRPGMATVSGQASMTLADGTVVYAAGSEVVLLPASSYVREIYDASQKAGRPLDFSNLDERLAQYLKFTQADDEGRFSFPAISDGDYLILTQVIAHVGDTVQGGDVSTFVTVADGQDVEVAITGLPRPPPS